MAKPNYAFAKRQRDLAKKKKQDEKRARKLGTPDKQAETNAATPPGADKTVT
jgi:hypothetical protein